jgi:nitrous oxidase accessory protein NosD
VISGVRISNLNGACITIPPGASGVVVRDSQIGPCRGDASIVVQGSGAVIEHNLVSDGRRGILAVGTSGATIRNNQVHGPFAGNSCGRTDNPSHCSSAIQFDKVTNSSVEGNQVRGSGYGSDAVSSYESSGIRFVNNDIDVDIAWMHAAAFTMGDSTTGNPGRDNYVAGNVVRSRGGVPPGVFGSSGNTVLERNCLTSGVQITNYSGVFVGVTVQKNVINMSASYVPQAGEIAGWASNIDSTDCSRIPS